MAERLQQQYEQKQQASEGVVSYKQRQQRRQEYMEQVDKVGLCALHYLHLLTCWHHSRVKDTAGSCDKATCNAALTPKPDCQLYGTVLGPSAQGGQAFQNSHAGILYH